MGACWKLIFGEIPRMSSWIKAHSRLPGYGSDRLHENGTYKNLAVLSIKPFAEIIHFRVSGGQSSDFCARLPHFMPKQMENINQWWFKSDPHKETQKRSRMYCYFVYIGFLWFSFLHMFRGFLYSASSGPNGIVSYHPQKVQPQKKILLPEVQPKSYAISSPAFHHFTSGNALSLNPLLAISSHYSIHSYRPLHYNNHKWL